MCPYGPILRGYVRVRVIVIVELQYEPHLLVTPPISKSQVSRWFSAGSRRWPRSCLILFDRRRPYHECCGTVALYILGTDGAHEVYKTIGIEISRLMKPGCSLRSSICESIACNICTEMFFTYAGTSRGRSLSVVVKVMVAYSFLTSERWFMYAM